MTKQCNMWWVVAGPILKIFICPNLHSRGEPSLVLRGAKIPSGRSSWSPLHCSLCTLTSMLELTTGYSHFLVKELKLFHIFTQNTNSNIDPVQKYWKKAATNIFTCFGQQRSRCQRQMEEFEIILNFFFEKLIFSLSFNIWFYLENKNRDYIQSLNSPLHWSVLKVSSNSTAEKVEAQQGQGTTKL